MEGVLPADLGDVDVVVVKALDGGEDGKVPEWGGKYLDW